MRIRSNSGLNPKFRRGKGVSLKSILKMTKIIDFFLIFLDILHKMRKNLGQEHVKRGPSILPGKNWENCF